MKYPINHELLKDEDVYLELKGLLGNAYLGQNGNRLYEKSVGTGIYTIKKNNGSELIASLKSANLFDAFPVVEIEGTKIFVSKKLSAQEYLFMFLPILLIFVGGFLGGIIGFIGASVNSRILRIPMPTIKRYGYTFGVSILSILLWLILVISLRLVVGS